MTIDWEATISREGRSWRPSAIRGLFPLEALPGMVSVLAGKPNPAMFPFAAISVEVKPLVPGDKPTVLRIDGAVLADGLQYGPTNGLKNLNAWMVELQKVQHHRLDTENWQVSLANGSQDMLAKTFYCILDHGDSLLVEAPVYPGATGALERIDVYLAEVPGDAQGLDAAALEVTLRDWDKLHPGKKFPKALYTIPIGGNPSGVSASLERKLATLALARKYNLVLIEDDAYFNLAYNPEARQPSYFDLEGQDGGEVGHVVRLDTFSKVLSAGLRLGMATGPKELLTVLDLATAHTNLQPNQTTQTIAFALLDHWGIDGFLEHCKRVAAFYDAQRQIFEAAAHRHLTGLATWVSPDAGMFLFLKLHLNKDGTDGDSHELIKTIAVSKGVLAVPGVAFSPNGAVSSYVRVSFSLATEADAEEACKRLRAVILEARGE